jgi:hypothetical protein
MKRSGTDIADQVAALQNVTREELAISWRKAHGSEPPKSMRHDLLVRSAAWHLQVKHFGGLSPATRRALKAAMGEVEKGMAPQALPSISTSAAADKTCATTARQDRRSVTPGARLLRDWNGKTHVVDVIENGFVFQAKVYSSLTAIARQITGAHWSGPRFFGL